MRDQAAGLTGVDLDDPHRVVAARRLESGPEGNAREPGGLVSHPRRPPSAAVSDGGPPRARAAQVRRV